MNLPCLFYYPERFFLASYCWFWKAIINAQQAFAYWKSQLRRQDDPVANEGQNYQLPTLTDAQLYLSEENQHQSLSLESSRSSHKLTGSLPSKTPHKRSSKLTSIFRRLSIRNFMEYCVIALNEASSSGCSNKFDFSLCDKPVWLLGRRYDLPEDGEKLVDDIRSRLWITYRRNFPPIDEASRYTTDRGFGCMIRCGQMVLANALVCKNLGRDWRWSPGGFDTNPAIYREILRLFQDRDDCPYSIHRIVRSGLNEGKKIGEWFGPNTIAQALKRISSELLRDRLITEDLLISVDAALDNVVVVDEIKSRFKHRKRTKYHNKIDSGSDPVVNEQIGLEDNEQFHDDKWIPGILFIQLRLGLTNINPLYFPALKKTFQFKNSLGIIGGRPNHALYLVGHIEEHVIYLDPHSTQRYIDFDNASMVNEESTQGHQNSDEPTQSASHIADSTYHCSNPEKMLIERLDPSLALCFHFNSETEFDEWCNLSHELLIKNEQAPMFEITKSRPPDWNLSFSSTTVTIGKGDRLKFPVESQKVGDKSIENHSSDHDEEFEMLA